MIQSMPHSRRILSRMILVAATIIWTPSFTAHAASEEASTLEFIAAPRTKMGHQMRTRPVDDLVVDRDGTPWILSGYRLFHLKDSRFAEPESEASETNGRPTRARLIGGADRGAYAIFEGPGEHEMRLFRLEKGRKTLITTLYREASASLASGSLRRHEGIYISESGRIFNWGDRFLAVFDGVTWHRIEARLSPKDTAIFDLGDTVYLRFEETLCVAKATEKPVAHPCALPVAEAIIPQQGDVIRSDSDYPIATRWAGRRALFIDTRRRKLHALDLPTGEVIDVSRIASALLSLNPVDAFSLDDGSVLILAGSAIRNRDVTYAYFRLDKHGDLAYANPSGVFDRIVSDYRNRSDAYLETADGTLFIARMDEGLLVARDGRCRHWG